MALSLFGNNQDQILDLTYNHVSIDFIHSRFISAHLIYRQVIQQSVSDHYCNQVQQVLSQQQVFFVCLFVLWMTSRLSLLGFSARSQRKRLTSPTWYSFSSPELGKDFKPATFKLGKRCHRYLDRINFAGISFQIQGTSLLDMTVKVS